MPPCVRRPAKEPESSGAQRKDAFRKKSAVSHARTEGLERRLRAPPPGFAREIRECRETKRLVNTKIRSAVAEARSIFQSTRSFGLPAGRSRTTHLRFAEPSSGSSLNIFVNHVLAGLRPAIGCHISKPEKRPRRRAPAIHGDGLVERVKRSLVAKDAMVALLCKNFSINHGVPVECVGNEDLR